RPGRSGGNDECRAVSPGGSEIRHGSRTQGDRRCGRGRRGHFRRTRQSVGCVRRPFIARVCQSGAHASARRGVLGKGHPGRHYPARRRGGWDSNQEGKEVIRRFESVKSALSSHESVLLLALVLEWFAFNLAGPRFGTFDNTCDILRHSVEIGLLALAMTPVILTGGIDLSLGSLLGLCAISFGKLWRDGGLSPLMASACALGIGALAGGLNATLITW